MVIAVSVPLIIFHSRSPVLMVFEESFLLLYGEERLQNEKRAASLSLFRPVIAIPVSNDAGDDIVSLAVIDTSNKPFCVLFPFRFIGAAKLYYDQNPHIPVVILEGRFCEYTTPSASILKDDYDEFYIYKTDISTDFYRAGLTAAALVISAEKAKAQAQEQDLEETDYNPWDGTTEKNIAVFYETNLIQANRAFVKGLNAFYDVIEYIEPQIIITDKIAAIISQLVVLSEQALIIGEQILSEQSEEDDETAENEAGTTSENTDSQGNLTGNSLEIAENSELSDENKNELSEIFEFGEDFEQEIDKIDDFFDFNSLHTADPPVEPYKIPLEAQFFTSFTQISHISDLSCVVLVDTGVEFLERKADIPVIFYSWVCLSMMPENIDIVIDDSPWAQIVQAVKMVKAGSKKGLIPSKFHFIGNNNIDKQTMRKIKKIW